MDTLFKDDIVSGPANQSGVRRFCEENNSVRPVDLADMAEKDAPLYSTDNETGILNVPYEILRLILLLLTTKERLPFGNTGKRFKILVFEDPKLLRHLDFSKKACLTTMTQVQQYFDSENACQHVRRIDANNVDCIKAGDPLNNSIGRAINLVEVNLHGTRFDDILQLGHFLKPLQHLEKLSIDWPLNVGNDISLCKRILQKPFSKLRYLSVRFSVSVATIFTRSLALCQQLEELYMQTLNWSEAIICRNSWNSEIEQLTNLKIVQYCGLEAIRIKEELALVLPDPKRWTDFQLCGATPPRGFYIEKDVEVCEELLQSERLEDFLSSYPWANFKLKWALNPEFLLKEVLKIFYRNAPEHWCCLSPSVGGQRHLLKVQEGKLLLKDPRYKISHLYLYHKLEKRCDAHRLVSAFPNLSELVLHTVHTDFRPPSNPRMERDIAFADPLSSFKTLVYNTPHLRHFTLDPLRSNIKWWDFYALRHISCWRNLETLRITKVPNGNGRFLIDIGKRCKNLHTLSLCYDSSFYIPTSPYSSDDAFTTLAKMLKYCRNLRDFTIKGTDFYQSQMFDLLAKNAELERVRIVGTAKHSWSFWISSLEKLIRQCAKLTTIICHTKFRSEHGYKKAVSAVKRIRAECDRPDFQIRVDCHDVHKRVGSPESVDIRTAFEDFPQNEPFPMQF